MSSGPEPFVNPWVRELEPVPPEPNGPPLEGAGDETVLLDGLCDLIRLWTQEEAFKAYVREPDSSEGTAEGLRPDELDLVSPVVHPGMVPRDVTSGYIQIDAIPHWPFVMVHFEHFDDALPYSTIITCITTGIYDPAEDLSGWRSAFMLLRKIKRRIWGESVTIGGYGRDMQSSSPGRVMPSNEVTHPFFMCETKIVWYYQSPLVQEESDFYIQNPALTPDVQRQQVIKATPDINSPSWKFGQPT